MSEICIHIPSLDPDHTVELEMTVNGQKHLMNYRVESLDWTEQGTQPEDRIQHLRRFIQNYDSSWELVHIGNPSGTLVPIMFRQRVTPEA